VIYDDLLKIIRNARTPEDAIQQIRKQLGGLRIYFPRRNRPKITHKDTPETLIKRYKVSRSTAHNWLNNYKN